MAGSDDSRSSLVPARKRVSIVPVDDAGSAALATARDGYRSLLVGTRAMRRDHAIARDAWFSALRVERKADLLFELEALLKGLACFANPRNHAGPSRRTAIAALDFREPLMVARAGLARVLVLVRTLLEEKDRSFVFQRYLEQTIEVDAARSRMQTVGAQQETPEGALGALRQAATHLLEVIDALGKAQRVSFRTFYSTLSLFSREVASNAFFNPISALEFRPEFDRIRSAEVLELLQTVPGEEAHKLVALSFLSLFRLLRYLALVDAIAGETQPARAYLVLAALRSDARALTVHVRKHAGPKLAEGYGRELFTVSARGLDARYSQLLAEGHRLLNVKGALEGIAAKLRLEVRRTFERDLPAVEAPPPPAELRASLLSATSSFRPALQATVLLLTRALGARLDAHFVFDDQAAKREVGERLRRDVWMFSQIVRGFAAKAAVVRTPEKNDRWASVDSFRFVQEFLAYFRAMGYPLLRGNDYPRFDQFIAAMSSLEEVDLLDPERFRNAVEECEGFHRFLMEVFEAISRREELAGTPFDKRAAAEQLRMYLGQSG
jgi:hypothetical protein